MRFTILAACAIFASVPDPVQADPPVRSLLEQRHSLVVTQRWDLSCGAAALATLLRFQHGISVDERTIAAGLIDRPEYLQNPHIIRARHGFSLLDMKRVAAQYGLDGEGFGNLTIDHLDALAPLIVKVDFHGFPHFVVYRGMKRGNVYLADPAFGQRSLPLSRFETAWAPNAVNGRVGFRLTRKDGAPPPDQLALSRKTRS